MLKHWMARVRAPLGYLLLAGLLATGAIITPYYLRTSLENFQPLELMFEPPQPILPTSATVGSGAPRSPGITQPLTNRVVLIVVSGLGQDDVAALPALQEPGFKQTSTSAHLFTAPVQPNQPGLITLLTGASVELTGGYSLDSTEAAVETPPASLQLARLDSPIACGNLLSCIKHNQNTTAFFGTPSWYNELNPEWIDYFATFPSEQPATDVSDAALNFLRKKSANFTLIQLNALNRAETDYGYNSPEALQARQSLNEALFRLTSSTEIELNKTTVIITGDWDNAMQTGDRWTIPLLMVGQAVQPGETFWGRQEDVASTVAALLGVETPRANQGRILTTALAMPSIDLAEKMLALVEQRRALAQAYRMRLGLSQPLELNDALAVDAEKSLRVAVQDYRLGSYDNVESVVDPVLRYARQDMTAARDEWFAEMRGQRALIVGGILLIPLLLMLIWRSSLAFLALLGAIPTVALPYLLYLAQGRQFAFNSTSPELLREDSLWRSGLALAVGLTLIALLFDWAERRRERVTGRIDLHYTIMAGLRVPRFPFPRLFTCSFLMLGWLVYFSGLIWFAWYYWRFGLIGPIGTTDLPALPDFSATFLQLFALDHLLGFALWMSAAPLVLAALVAFKRYLRGKGEKQSNEEFDPHRLLHPESSAIIKV
ncbi:MAG: hypothetical protein HXX20_15265 [Chloroflexi bacterium]|nr:hypothetical protein [Chloroflexota bacterium]